MTNIALDLFLLMSSLAQLKNRERIIRLFGEAVSSLHNGFSVSYAGTRRPEGNALEICTANGHFGYIQMHGDLVQVAPEFGQLLQNAVQMLAVILENLSLNELLAEENAALGEMVDERTRSLQESEAALRAILEAVRESVFMMDTEGVVLCTNATTALRLGCQPEDLLGRNIFANLPDDVIGHRRGYVRQVVDTRQPVQFFDKRLGRCLLNSIYPIPDARGQVTRLAVFGMDITERRQAEELVRIERDLGLAVSKAATLQEALRHCMEAALAASEMDSGAIYLVNEAGGIDLAHCVGLAQAFESLGAHFDAGSPQVQLLMRGEPVYLFPENEKLPRDSVSLLEGLRAVMILPIQARQRIVAGIVVSSHTSAEISAFVRAALEDIAGRIGATIERLRAQEALRASEERFRTLVELAAVGVCQVATQSGRYLMVNQRYCDLLGYSRDELMQLTVTDVTHPDDRKTDRDLVDQMIRGEIREFMLEKRFMRRDGKIVWGGLAVAALWPPGAVVTSDIGVVVDITRRKLAEQALQEAQERLVQNEKLASLGQIVAGMAHELNNPLAAVVLHSQLLQQGASDERLRQRLDTIVAEAMRAAEIVRSLKEFARQRPVNLAPVQVNDLLMKCLQLAAGDLERHHVRWITHFTQDLPVCLLDYQQIQQVFMNLIKNAWQAIASVRPAGVLTVTTLVGQTAFLGNDDQSGPLVRVIFADDGPGIPANMLSRLFDPFFTTRQQGDGTGLGLAISHGIVAEHGGHIWAESSPGMGARMIVELPIVPPAGGSKPADGQTGKNLKSSPETPASLLVIDDEPDLLEAVTLVLRQSGYQVSMCNNSPKALEILQTRQFDLVLCDIQMPQVTGMELYARVKENNLAMAGRFLFITGDQVNSATREFLEQSRVACLSKPFDLEQLLTQVRGRLGQRG